MDEKSTSAAGPIATSRIDRSSNSGMQGNLIRQLNWLFALFIRGLKWFFGHPLEGLLAAAVIIVLTVSIGYALTGTDQGRDLLLLAQDQESALKLYSGLSTAMMLVVLL